MKYFYRFIFICCILILPACTASPIKRLIGNKYTNLLDGKITGLDTMINLHGFYSTVNSTDNLVMFYNDGTFADLIGMKKSNDSISMINGWGHYYLEGDVIKAQVINAYGGIIVSGYTKYIVDVVDRWFKIINKDTIQEIYWFNCSGSEKGKNWAYLNSFSTFHPLKEKPDSNCWLKTKTWAWKDGIIKK
jgi:hypothetical protein